MTSFFARFPIYLRANNPQCQGTAVSLARRSVAKAASPPNPSGGIGRLRAKGYGGPGKSPLLDFELAGEAL